MTKSKITVKRENFLMGLKIDFEFFKVGQFYLGFPAKKFYKGISNINFRDPKRFSDLAENWLR